MVMVENVLIRDDAGFIRKKSRPISIVLSMLTLRLIENWQTLLKSYEHAEIDDLDCTLIVLSVVAIGAEKFTRRGLEQHYLDLGNALPAGHLSPCNLSSIASATGIHRETVRRKVRSLVAAGILEKERDDGIRVTPAFAARPTVLKCIRSQIEAISRAVKHLGGV